MLITDHINAIGTSPLWGLQNVGKNERFIPLNDAYSPNRRSLAKAAASELGIDLKEGIYLSGHGPEYETPAEIQMMKRLGVSAVGMSTVPEVIVARQLGIPVLAIATITNKGAGLSNQPPSHEEVEENAKAAAASLAKLLETIAPRIPNTTEE